MSDAEILSELEMLRAENEKYRAGSQKLQKLLIEEENRSFELYDRALNAERELRFIKEEMSSVEGVKGYLAKLCRMRSFESQHAEFLERDRERSEFEKRLNATRPVRYQSHSMSTPVITKSGLRMSRGEAIMAMAGA